MGQLKAAVDNSLYFSLDCHLYVETINFFTGKYL